ncbi:MAG: hypothetical protein HKP59_05260 [Lutibacter sp.]|uniref:hypothetical protein n=1 Tax=Lutibacter sp. TaxID=1925666 RepID=UPI00183C2194|nr:hypothetical protein [Lutibacter sp.]MBT8317012.1 hypothetical protein [Lutibacter sp.]NNJ57872.1 hypothetical protein [Lutibacter sp.]
MRFSISNLFKSKKKEVSVEDFPKIDFKGGSKYAEDEKNTVYLDFEELGGFPFIQTIIIGEFSTKIKRVGCTLTFVFESDELTIHSDNTDIGSSEIKNTPFYYTEIDFELNEEESKRIQDEKVIEIQYQFKEKMIRLKTI